MAKLKKLIDISDKQIEEIYDSGKEATVSFIRVLVDKINELAIIVEKQQHEINQFRLSRYSSIYKIRNFYKFIFLIR